MQHYYLNFPNMLQEYCIYLRLKIVCKQLKYICLRTGRTTMKTVYFLVLAKNTRYQSSSFNSSWLKLFIELHIATTVASWISLQDSSSFFCSSEWTLNSTFFFFFLLCVWFWEISWKETPLVKTKVFKEKVGTKWTYQRQLVIHGLYCALPLSLPQYTLLFYRWIRARQTIALLLATKNHLGKKGMLSAERENRNLGSYKARHMFFCISS